MGAGQRIAWHYDIDADADVDSNDNWLYFVHDDRWRIMATYRGNGAGSTVDANPKERFVFHAAGLGGNGGSSYIDSVILRDRDNTSGWNSASDNVLEERRYFVQNWRADVVAVIKDNRAMVERVKYSAYGVPFNLPMGDTDCDGDTDSTDVTQINSWIGLGYQALGDTDLDGDVDLTDKNNADANKITTGRGVLSYSGVRSRLGYAGYQHSPELSSTMWGIRHRILNSETGRWNTRDPIGHCGGQGLYEYGHSNGVRYRDSSGLTPVGEREPGWRFLVPADPMQPHVPGGDPSPSPWMPSPSPTPNRPQPVPPEPWSECVRRSADITSCRTCCPPFSLLCNMYCAVRFDPEFPQLPSFPFPPPTLDPLPEPNLPWDPPELPIPLPPFIDPWRECVRNSTDAASCIRECCDGSGLCRIACRERHRVPPLIDPSLLPSRPIIPEYWPVPGIRIRPRWFDEGPGGRRGPGIYIDIPFQPGQPS